MVYHGSGLRRDASALTVTKGIGATMRKGKSTIVVGGSSGGSHLVQLGDTIKRKGAAHRTSASKFSNALKAPLCRVSCGLHNSTIGDSVLDDSLHAADMVYRMTGTTGSLAYMAPEVLRGTFYSEKVDVFSLAVVMYELLSYAPMTARVTGEDMVDRMYHYAEKVAGGFRQELPEAWPPQVRALISDSWAANPMLRPSAAKIAKQLRAMHHDGLLKRWDEADRRALRTRPRHNRLLQYCGCLTSRPSDVDGPFTA